MAPMPDQPPAAVGTPVVRVRWRARFGWWVAAAVIGCLAGLVAATGLSWAGFTVTLALCGGVVVGATGFVASVLIDAAMENRFGEHSLVTSTVSAVGAFVSPRSRC